MSFGGIKKPSMRPNAPSSSSPRGQVFVIVAGGMIVIVGLVGLVIDGGYAWGQQRRTQNGADAIAEAGATVLVQVLKGATKTDGDVGCAVAQVAAANSISNPTASYTDVDGNFLTPVVNVGPCNSTAAIPAGAQGVKARGERQFDTFLARVMGFNQFTASADATAVAGLIVELCGTGDPCPVLPVTFPITTVICDGQNDQVQIGPNYVLTDLDPTSPNFATTANESIIPLCKAGPGAVGWLDFGCGNLSQTISMNPPCDVTFSIPQWVHTEPGNTNSLDDEINVYAGPQLGVPDDSMVLIPLNDNTCMTDPGAQTDQCPGGNGSGNGNNFYYHIPKFTRFMIDQVYTGGSNDAACNQAPGQPRVGGNGATGCLKGWFINWVETGVVGPGATGPLDPGQVGIQLIR
jgi:putative Flp pilus-assembly TadE/G-like protein